MNCLTDKYLFADKVVQITSLYQAVHEYCKDFRCTGTADIEVSITQDDIDFERERNARTSEKEGSKAYYPSDSYIEQLAVYRKISEQMPRFDTFLFHGSCISVDGEGYMFTAPSGTGKSTHARLWREYLGDRAVMVNDDKPLIRVSDDTVTAFGTAYNGKHHLGGNISVPLKAIALLERAEQNSIEEVTPKQIYPRILQQMYRPYDAAALAMSMGLLDKMMCKARLYIIRCNMDIQAAQIAYDTMKGR